MSSEEELIKYRLFLDEFSAQNKSDEDYDFSSIKVYLYRLNESEIDAEIISCCLQYLYDNKCPIKLQGPVIQFVLENLHDALNSKINLQLYGYDENNKTFDSIKIRTYALNNVKLYCQQLLDNVEFNKVLPKLQDPDDSPLFAVSCVKNKRRYNADRYCIINNFNSVFNIKSVTDETNFYAVFDGHDGIHASYYSSSQLPYALAKNPLYLTNPIEAIRQAFLSVDATFVEKAYSQAIKGGTTVVCALHRPHEKQLYVAWVGDSRALLVKQGKIMQIVESHKPENLKEKKRVTSAGGCVMNLYGILRVDGLLNITRSIGDSICKPYVCAEPDIVALELDNDEDFLILACDGLWDHVKEEDIASIVYEQLKEDCEDLQKITKKLVEKAKLEGSSDNTTIVIIFLKHPSQIAKSSWKLQIIEQKFQNEKALNSIEEEELADDEKVLRNDYENGGHHNQTLDLVDFLNFNSRTNDNIATARNDEMQRSDAELEEKFQEHFSSGKNFDDNEIKISSNQLEIENPVESEICDESEEDEWNYIQLKEGEGEKKIIQSEIVVSTKLVEDYDNEEKNILYEIKDDSELPSAMIDEQSLLNSTESSLQTESLSDQENHVLKNGINELESYMNSDIKHYSPKLKLKLNDEIIAQSPRKDVSGNMENIQIPDKQKFDDEADARPHEITDLNENTSLEIKMNTTDERIDLLSDCESNLNNSVKSESTFLSKNDEMKDNNVTDVKHNNKQKQVEDFKKVINGISDIKINVIKKPGIEQTNLEKNSKIHQPRTTNIHKLRTVKTTARVPKITVKSIPVMKTSVEKKMLKTISKPSVDHKTTATLPIRKPISNRTLNSKILGATIPPIQKATTIQKEVTSRPHSVQSSSNTTTKTNSLTKKLIPTVTKRIIPRETLTSALRKNEATKVPASKLSTKPTTTKSIPTTRKTISATTLTNKTSPIGKDRKVTSTVITKKSTVKENTENIE